MISGFLLLYLHTVKRLKYRNYEKDTIYPVYGKLYAIRLHDDDNDRGECDE